jgi:hypothetical protein
MGSPESFMGVCVCDTTVLNGADLIVCDGVCVHRFSDWMNCGGCGAVCQGPCVDAKCYPCDVDAGLVACPPPACLDVTDNVQNCGGCDNDCTQGGTAPFTGIECRQGRCLCNDGWGYVCPSSDPTLPFPTMACVDPNMDPDNCGGCGLLADGGGPYLDGGLPPSPNICPDLLCEMVPGNSTADGFETCRLSCQSGSCLCPGGALYCPPGTWGGGDPSLHDSGVCLDDKGDPRNCGGCGIDCDTIYASKASCIYSSCACAHYFLPDGSLIDGGIDSDGGLTSGIDDLCVTATSGPLSPTCSCDCDAGILKLTFQTDIFPLLSSTTVTDEPTWPSGGVLVGCAVSGCHDSTAAAGLDFTDPDASYQALAGGTTSMEMCPFTPVSIINPSLICPCQSLVIPFDSADSLLYELLVNSSDYGQLPLSWACAEPIGGTVNPMPIDDGGTWHQISDCLIAEVRQWIDHGAVY